MLFGETFFGLLLHDQLASKLDAFKYPEERAGYVVPDHYKPGYKTRQASTQHDDNNVVSGSSSVTAAGTEETDHHHNNKKNKEGDADSLEGPPTSMTEDDPYLVDWDGEDDSDNPQRWPFWKKSLFVSQLMLLTTSVYMGSSIVSPAIPYMAQYFGVGRVPATLSLTLFVLGYGIGPIIGLCAASEIPVIGRCKPYIITLFIFTILQIPTALVDNIAGLMILRFLAGIFGSPPLATGGASMGDVFGPKTAPLALGLWGLSASAGPVLGPIIGGFASEGYFKLTGSPSEAWRWTIWPLLMLSGFTLLMLTFTMPETSASNILYRRAARLRKVSGNPHLRTRGELFMDTMTGKEVAMMTFVRPFRLGLFEPIALSINLHIGMVYGVLYVWFEAFPIVFAETYGFTPGLSGVAFCGILVGNLFVYFFYYQWFVRWYRPRWVESGGRLAPENWLYPAMVGGIALPMSLFAFGWTANASIHWIVPIITTGLFSVGIFGLFASGLNYLAIAYPDYIASVFSANDFMRASVGAALPLVANAMFTNLQANGPKAFPVAWGCTLLGCVSLALAPVPFLLYIYGPALRRISKFAADTFDDTHGKNADHNPTTSFEDRPKQSKSEA